MKPIGKKQVFVAVVDSICVFVIALPVILLYVLGEPTQRGFFCDDETIRYPYKPSTVPTIILIIVCTLVPFIIFVSVEFALAKSSGSKSLGTFLSSLYNILIVFIFGLAVTQCITDICKYSIGRLRPHFLDVCNTTITTSAYQQSKKCGTDIQPLYVQAYECEGNKDLFSTEEERESRIQDARLSFVSGHASMSFYAMLFSIIYLHTRLTNRNYRLVKPLIQLGCSLFAVYTALTRVMDYKHHPGDVIGGSIIGITIAILTHLLSTGRFGYRPGVTTATSTTTLLPLSTRDNENNQDWKDFVARQFAFLKSNKHTASEHKSSATQTPTTAPKLRKSSLRSQKDDTITFPFLGGGGGRKNSGRESHDDAAVGSGGVEKKQKHYRNLQK